jgi:tetratricopeptide (TPR) repeat protein
MRGVLKYYIRIFIFLFPIFFLPVVTDPFGLGKNLFLTAGAIIGLFLWFLDFVFSKNRTVEFNKLFWVMVGLIIWSLISCWKLPVGAIVKSWMYPVGLGTITAMTIWTFLWIQVSDKDEYKKQFGFLTASGLVLAILSLLIFLVPTSKFPVLWPKDNPLISINQGWSLAGSIFAEVILFVFLCFEWTKKMILKLHRNEDYIKEAVITAFFCLVLFLDLYKIFKLGWVVLDGYSAWVIAVETLKRSPILGVGLGNFFNAFSVFRPNSYNLTKFWSMGFSNSSMSILQIWTELGIGGLVLILMMIGGWFSKKRNKNFWLFGLMMVLILFLPMNLMSIFLFLWFLNSKIIFEKKEIKLVLKLGESDFNVMLYFLGGLILIGGVWGGYWWTKFLLGDYFLQQSLLAAVKNNGSLTYQMEIKAIAINPNQPDYRKIYSQTNLALAQNLLSNKDVSSDDKQKAATLIQQSVREAKTAISLDSNNSSYWSNLGVIYKQLIGVADGSLDWSVQAYTQAIALDPVNPLLKLDLGGLLFAANRFDEADKVFEQGILNKNDYANLWYNWAYTAKKLNKLSEAVDRLTQAVSLVPGNSSDFDKASKELSDWKKELDSAKQNVNQQKNDQSILSVPQPISTNKKQQGIDLSQQDLKPPAVASGSGSLGN